MKSPRKISTDEFMQLVRDEFDNLMNLRRIKNSLRRWQGLFLKYQMK